MQRRQKSAEQWREAATAVLRARFPDDPDLDLMLALVDSLAEEASEDGHLVLTRRLHRRLYHLARRHR
jgi:hypothetical protein